MTQSDEAQQISKAAERITGTWFCHSGKHRVSNTIASTTHRGRRTCANCAARIHQHRKKDSHE